jgi:hypothetical protein
VLPHQLFTEQHSPSENPRHVKPFVPPHFPSVEVTRLGVELGAEDDESARVDAPVTELLTFVLETGAILDEGLLDDALLVGTLLEDFEVKVVAEEDNEVLVDEAVLELEVFVEDADVELEGFVGTETDAEELETLVEVVEEELDTFDELTDLLDKSDEVLTTFVDGDDELDVWPIDTEDGLDGFEVVTEDKLDPLVEDAEDELEIVVDDAELDLDALEVVAKDDDRLDGDRLDEETPHLPKPAWQPVPQ